MEKQINSRIINKIDTTDNWNSSSLVLKDGELGIEKLSDGTRKIKIGDGVSLWSELEYIDSDIPTKVSDLENDAGYITEHQDISNKANNDLSNVDNVIFKEKIEASGFSSGTQAQIITWEDTD